MKTKNENSIEKNNTLDILDEIQEVKVSPFFKNKVLNQIREQQEETVQQRGWFTPQLQLAAVIVVLLINAVTLFYTIDVQSSNQELSGIEAFVQDYSLESDSNISLN